MLHQLGGLQQHGVQQLVQPDAEARVQRLFARLSHDSMDATAAVGVLTGESGAPDLFSPNND